VSQDYSQKKHNLLIVHGWAIDPLMKKRWQPLMKLIQDKGYQVKYLQIPGFEEDLESSWDLDDYADWLKDKLARTKNCVLIGHSFGGQISCRAAASQPKNLKAMVLIGPAGVIDRGWQKQLKRYIFGSLANFGKPLPIGKFKNFCQKTLYKLAREKDYFQAPIVLKKTMAIILKEEVIKDLPKISVPVLIFWGKKDHYTPHKHASIFRQGIKDCRLISIPRAGHCPQYTHTDFLVDNIIDFLKYVD
jgi:pimeloyl-ACP methyl ester carboxylesterase